MLVVSSGSYTEGGSYTESGCVELVRHEFICTTGSCIPILLQKFLVEDDRDSKYAELTETEHKAQLEKLLSEENDNDDDGDE